MTREALQKYLNLFCKIYPTHPDTGTWEVYHRALADVADMDGVAACEICLGELKFFPMPAQIKERVRPKDDFVVTTEKEDTEVKWNKNWTQAEIQEAKNNTRRLKAGESLETLMAEAFGCKTLKQAISKLAQKKSL